MDSPLVIFLSGVLAGSVLTTAAHELAGLVARRRAVREAETKRVADEAKSAEFEAAIVEDAKVIHGLFASALGNGTTPGCDCDYCTAQKAADERRRN